MSTQHVLRLLSALGQLWYRGRAWAASTLTLPSCVLTEKMKLTNVALNWRRLKPDAGHARMDSLPVCRSSHAGPSY